MKNILMVLAVFGTCAAGGCGYTARSALPQRIRTIYIESPANKLDYAVVSDNRSIYIPLIEEKIRDAVSDRFLFDGNLRVVPDSAGADLVLKGSVLEFNRNPLRYTDDDDVQEYRIQIVMALELMDTRGEQPMWTSGRFIGQTTYFVTGAQAVAEDTAVDNAVIDLARRIVERTVENW